MAELSRQAARQLPRSQPLISKVSKKLPVFQTSGEDQYNHPLHRCHHNHFPHATLRP